MNNIFLTILQLLGPPSFIIIGNILVMWKNEAKILGEISRRHDILDLKLVHIEQHLISIDERVRKLESFRDDVYRSGVMKSRASED